MDGRQYLPTVAWSFKVRDVILLTKETIESPSTFRCTAIPFDSSEPGANEGTKDVGFYVTDNIGNIYSIIGIGEHTVDLSDDFRCGVGPQTGKWAVLSKSVGNGTAPFLTPIHYRRLDKSSVDNVRRIELDILWKQSWVTKSSELEVITANSETIINKYIAPDHLHLLETYCVGGRGDSSDTHVAQLVATDPAIPGVTVYSYQEIIW